MAQRAEPRPTRPNNSNGRRRPAEQRETPHDPAAETALLGAMLGHQAAIEAALANTSSSDFAEPVHGHIYDAIQILHGAGEGVDPTSVHAWLIKNLDLDPNDGQGLGATSLLGGLLALRSQAAPVSVAATHARNIRELAHRRRLITLAGDLTEHAYTGQDPAATLDRLAELGTATTETDRLREQLLIGEAIMNIPPPNPLIEGLLDLNSLAALYGRANHGKSFVAIDWALSVATGSWWFGHKVVPGRVLYILAEGPHTVPARIEAWKHARQTWNIGDIMWLPTPVDIYDRTNAVDVARFAKDLKPTFIILDTLARSVPAADENSAKDMGLVVANADRLRRATGACVLVVHHTGRDEARGMRGSTVLEAAMDTTIECRKNDDGAIELTSVKQKMRPTGKKIKLALANVQASCVLAPWRGDSVVTVEDMPPTAHQVLSALQEVDTGDGVSATVWMESSNETKSVFYRWRKKFLDLGLVSENGDSKNKRFSVTDEGLAALGIIEMEYPEQF